MSASVNLSRGGQPSTTTPTPPPWDSPQVVMRNNCPNEFAISTECGKSSKWSTWGCLRNEHPDLCKDWQARIVARYFTRKPFNCKLLGGMVEMHTRFSCRHG